MTVILKRLSPGPAPFKSARHRPIRNTRFCRFALALAVFAPLTEAAEAKLFTYSGHLIYTSNYVLRGVSQTLQRGAVQGGYELNTGFGLNFGTWGSSVADATGNGLELNSYITFGLDIEETLLLHIGTLDYRYSGTAAYRDYTELLLRLSFLGFSLTVTETDDYQATGSRASWARARYLLPVYKRLFLEFEYGKVRAKQPLFADKRSYAHMGSALVVPMGVSELKLAITDSTHKACGDICSLQTALSWTHFF